MSNEEVRREREVRQRQRERKRERGRVEERGGERGRERGREVLCGPRLHGRFSPIIYKR